MNRDIFVSVVIPTYNRASQLNACLSSLFKQDYAHEYEVVVVDDNSVDETDKVLKKFSREHPNLKVIRNPKNMGSYYSRNLAVSIAKGNIVAFTDSDCIVPSDWLYKIHNSFQNNKTSCIQGTSERKGKWELPIPKEQALDHPVFSIRKGLDARNFAIRKSLFLKYKFDTQNRFAADLDLGHRLAEDNVTISFDRQIWVTHIDPRGFWEAIEKGKTRGHAYAWLYRKQGWKGVNPKLGYPLWFLFFYYLGSFFYFLLRYRSFRGSITTAIINIASATYFKSIISR